LSATNATVSSAGKKVQGQANVSSEITVYAVSTLTGSNATVNLLVKAGKMTHIIKITVLMNRAGTINVRTSQPLFAGKKDVVFYSWDGREFLGDTDAQIYADWNSGVGVCTVKSNSVTGLPFSYASTGGCVAISSAGKTLPASPQVLAVGPELLPQNAGTGLLASALTFTTPPPAAAVNTEIRLFLKNFYVRCANEGYVVCDNSQNQEVSINSNVDFTIEPYDYPPALLALAPPPGKIDATSLTDNSASQMTSNVVNTGDDYLFKLPTLTVEDFERLGLPNPLMLQFKVKASPSYLIENHPEYLPEAGLEKIITVKAVPYAGDANSYITPPRYLHRNPGP
jgi:hypothetical protein